MKKTIRIYYECLEQALYLITPSIKTALKAIDSTLPITYVRGNWKKSTRCGPIDTFRYLNTPDILVSMTIGADAKEREYPLFIVEMSEAVKTEDHELQRSAIVAASLWSQIPVIKISGERASTLAHGGNKDFDPHMLTKLFYDQVGLRSYFYQEWPSVGGRLCVQKYAQSCPPVDKLPILQAVVNAACQTVVKIQTASLKMEDICDMTLDQCEKSGAVEAYWRRVDASKPNPGSMVGKVLLKQTNKIKMTQVIGSRVALSDDGIMYLKFNRFDHAGDPDRGVLIALSNAWKGKVLLRYGMEDKGKTHSKPKLRDIFNRSKNVLDAFMGYCLEEGLPRWLCDIFNKNGGTNVLTDITKQILVHEDDIQSNILLRSIFFFSHGLVAQLHRGGAVAWTGFKWDRELIYKKMGPTDSNIPQKPIAIKPANQPNEDEVTYVTLHGVLRPNGFQDVCVSYPGHQAGGSILRSCEKGRVRSRIYVDILSMTPSVPQLPVLTESKERLDGGLKRDIIKLTHIRHDKHAIEGIRTTLSQKGFDGWKSENIVVSVAFGGTNHVIWTPKDIDFIVRLNGRESFSVAPFGEARRYFSKIVTGPTGLPDVYEQGSLDKLS